MTVQPPYSRVSAHRLDRMGSVVVGQILPYNEALGERVEDDHGVVWQVVSSSVRSAEFDMEEQT